MVGAGSWGTAMASHLVRRGHQVSLWAREEEVVRGIRDEGRNPLFLKGVEHLFPIIDSVRESWSSRVKTASLNSMLREVLEKTPPPSKKGKKLNIYYVTQARTAPPHFVFFVNDPDLVTPAYARFLEKKIRELFGFLGSPVRLTFRPRPRKPRS